MRFAVTEAGAFVTILAMAGGEVNEPDFIAWIYAFATPRG